MTGTPPSMPGALCTLLIFLLITRGGCTTTGVTLATDRGATSSTAGVYAEEAVEEEVDEEAGRAYMRAFIQDRRNQLYVYELLSASLCPIGYVLNFLSFLVFWRMSRRQRQAVILVMMALTVVDPAATIINIDYVISATSGYSWQQNTNVGCKVINYLTTVAKDCSNAFTVLIALERCVSVYFPLKVALWFTRRRVLLATAFTCLFFTGLETYRFVGFQKQTNFGHDYCSYKPEMELLTREMGLAVTRCAGFLVPWCCVTVLNFLLLLRLRRWRLERRKLGAKEESRNQSLTLMFLAMSLFSLATNLLDLVNVVIYLTSGVNYIRSYRLYTISSILVLCNHTCNFVFYALAGASFRRTLLALLSCGKYAVEETSVYNPSVRNKHTASSVKVISGQAKVAE